MRTGLSLLALTLVVSLLPPPAQAAASRPKDRQPAAAKQRTRDAAAEAYKLEQQARLVYWICTYRQALAALKRGRMSTVRPYPRQAVLNALFREMNPEAQAYARRLHAIEARTMAKHARANTVDRAAVMRGIQAILAGLDEEQKLLDAMPVEY